MKRRWNVRNHLTALAVSFLAIASVYIPQDTSAQSICSNVFATAVGGVSFGNIVAGACGPAIGDNSFTCPGLKAFSLVAKVNGQCIQLGSSGAFVAPASGS